MEQLTKTPDTGIEKFEQLQKSVNEQISALTTIQVIDETSLAVANQQLSKAKQFENFIDEARLLIQEKEFKFCKEVNAKAKVLAVPLETSQKEMKDKILTYTKAEQIRKQRELEEIAKKQKEVEQEQLRLQQEENNKAIKLQEDIVKFESQGFNAIHTAKTMEELSTAYTTFVLSFPKEYGDVVLGRIKSLGVAKAKMLSPDVTADKNEVARSYNEVYATVTGTEVKIEAKVIETPLAVVTALEEQKQNIIIQSAPTNIRKNWDWEVDDIRAVPIEWLMVDEKKVDEWKKQNKETLIEGVIHGGIRFFIKETVVTK